MAKKEIVPVEVQVNTKGATQELSKTQKAVEGVKSAFGKVGDAAKSFGTLAKTIGGNVVKAFTSLKVAAAAVNFGAIIELVKKLYENWESIQKVITNFIPGFGKFVGLVKGLVQNFTDFIGLTSQAERDVEALAKANEKINAGIDNQIKLLQAQGGQEEQIYQLQKKKNENEIAALEKRLKLTKELSDEDQQRLDDLQIDQKVLDATEQKRLKDEEKARNDEAKARNDKAKAEADKRVAKSKADKEAINQQIKTQADAESNAQKILLENYKATLNDRGKALLDSEEKFEQQRAALIKAGIYDFSEINKAEIAERSKINEDFNKKEKADQDQKIKELKDKWQETFEFIQKAREADEDNKLALDELNAKTEDEKDAVALAKIQLKYARQIEAAKKAGTDILTIEQLQAAEIDALNSKSSENRKKLKEQERDSELAIAQSTLSVIGGLVDQNSAAGKGIAIAQAIINTYQGASKALAQGGIFGPIAAATTIAAGLIQVKKIVSTKVPSVKGGTVADKGGLSSVSAPISPTPNVQATLTQLDQSTVNRLGSASARAYVVESDITSKQEQIKRINRAARLS